MKKILLICLSLIFMGCITLHEKLANQTAGIIGCDRNSIEIIDYQFPVWKEKCLDNPGIIWQCNWVTMSTRYDPLTGIMFHNRIPQCAKLRSTAEKK